MTTNNNDDEIFRKCVKQLKERKIKVVAFDMDQTAVSVHSHGELRRDKLNEYLLQATPDFVKLIPRLHEEGIGLAIATHSDEAEFRGEIKPDTHVLGSEIAKALVEKYFSCEIASAFLIIAYNPRVRPGGDKEENKIKRYHMHNISEHFKCRPEEILFLDDTESVVKDCNEFCGVNTILVDPRRGFQIHDILDNL